MKILIALCILICAHASPVQAENATVVSVIYITSAGSLTPVVRHPTKRTIAICLGKKHSFVWVPDVLLSQGAVWLQCDDKGVFRWSRTPFPKPR